MSFTGPFCLISSIMTSSTGSRLLASACGNQLVMYKMSWPDLACASAARVISALLPVKRSTWTSTFSFAAHSWINASDVLLASGTKWSQNPIESLPAACAVLTNGAATIVVDAAADVAMNRRRVNIFPVMVFAPFCARAASGQESQRQIGQFAADSSCQSCCAEIGSLHPLFRCMQINF